MDSGLKNKLPTRNVLNGINLATQSLLTRQRGEGRNQEMVSRNRECCHREMEGFYAPSVS